MFEWLGVEAVLALITLIALEIVLGIDNIIFISIVVEDLPKAQRRRARMIGLALALVARVGLLLALTWIIGLVQPVFTIFENEISWRDIIMIVGGLFLLGKSTMEIHGSVDHEDKKSGKAGATFGAIIIQILILDLVFSFDSVVTAIGMVDEVTVMVIAVVIAMIFMLIFSEFISRFIEKYPTLKMLALGFLLMVGFVLIADGLDVHIPKPYIYFAMAFSLFIEFLNIRNQNRKKAKG
jgi:predicted tellurium resistance membrane protein TerC